MKVLSAFEIANRKIPPSEVVHTEYRECGGGYGTWVITTKDGKQRWTGCGHFMCCMCGLASAHGVGDEAYRDFQDFWEGRGATGPCEAMPGLLAVRERRVEESA